jgi:uncharacterized protein YlxP (DUF503 family)
VPGYVGILRADLHLPHSHSLKEKRRELRRITSSMLKAGCAASESDHHDLWQRAGLLLAVTGPDAAHVDRRLDGISRGLHTDPVAIVLGESRMLVPETELELSAAGIADERR